jgi:uncharacterized protein (TIGR03437 family)
MLNCKFFAFLFLGAYGAYAAPSIAGVVNAATFKLGGIAPGTLISIFGAGFSTITMSASAVPLPTILSGTSVSINGVPSPLVFVSPGQINAQIPYGLSQGTVTLVVRDAAGAVANSTIQVVTASPGIFTKTSDGKGEAIAVHSNYSLVNRAVGEYAQIGETVVVYCTGLGEVNGFSTAGSAAPSSPLPSARQIVEVTMNGQAARVVYAGLTPGSVGLYQVNVAVPGGIGGDVAVSIKVGAAISNLSTINVAGVFSLAGSYTGALIPRDGPDRFQLDFSSMVATATPDRFTGAFSVSQAGKAVSIGTFEFRSSQTVFTVVGKSVTGDPLYGVMDTLDAGESFIGLLLIDPQNSDSWYARFTVVRKAPSAPAPPTGTLPGGTFSCAAVEGAGIYSQDGKFLGKITSNRFDQDSIGNSYGSYGSSYSSNSIFNTFGAYGSDFSSTSAFNQFASSPPVIVIGGRVQWYLTVNASKSPRIQPTQLYPCIGRQ